MTVRGFCLKDCQYDNSNVTFLSTTSFPQTDSHAGAQLFHSTPEVKSLPNRFPCQSPSPSTAPCLLLLEEICKTDSVYTPDLEKGFGMTVSLNPQVSLDFILWWTQYTACRCLYVLHCLKTQGRSLFYDVQFCEEINTRPLLSYSSKKQREKNPIISFSGQSTKITQQKFK